MTDHAKSIKKRIIQFLNNATTSVMHSYGRYLSEDLPEDINEPSKTPEEFRKFHDAGKSAASHLETLMKLTNASDDPEERENRRNQKAEDESRQEKLKAMQAAKAELEGKNNG